MTKKEQARKLAELEASILERQYDLMEECQSLRRSAASLEDRLRCDRIEKMGVLDTPPEPVFDNLLELLTLLSDYEGAMLTFIDTDRMFVKGSVGSLKIETIPRDESICNFAIKEADKVFVVPDAASDLRFSNLLPVKQGLRTYAGKAVTSVDGVPVGAVCLVDSRTKPVTDHAVIALEKAAKIISHILALKSQDK